MDKEGLRNHLEQLHAELQQAKPLDENEREMLKHLANDIREILESENDDSQQLGQLGKRLQDGLAQFEATHPKAALFMRQLIDQLSVLGI